MAQHSRKRRFSQLRRLILETLAEGQKTVNQIASETGINWKTVDNHLTYLVGRGLAHEVFSSKFVRIFEITDRGDDAVKGDYDDSTLFEKNGRVSIT